jgi:hypothetical protein
LAVTNIGEAVFKRSENQETDVLFLKSEFQSVQFAGTNKG